MLGLDGVSLHLDVSLPSERRASPRPAPRPPGILHAVDRPRAGDRIARPIALVGSSGGHLDHLLALEGFWAERDRFWVTFDKIDATSRLRDERVYWASHPTNRHLGNLLRNTFQAVRVLLRERPCLVISSGAGAAIPYLVLGRLFGCKTAFVEVFDRIDSPTVTGRIAYRFCTAFFVQWEEQRRFYPNARLVGPLL